MGSDAIARVLVLAMMAKLHARIPLGVVIWMLLPSVAPSEMTCFSESQQYVDERLAGEALSASLHSTPFACQSECQHVATCDYFVWRAAGGVAAGHLLESCWLLEGHTTLEDPNVPDTVRVVIGPKRCPETPDAASSTNTWSDAIPVLSLMAAYDDLLAIPPITAMARGSNGSLPTLVNGTKSSRVGGDGARSWLWSVWLISATIVGLGVRVCFIVQSNSKVVCTEKKKRSKKLLEAAEPEEGPEPEGISEYSRLIQREAP